MPVKGVGAISWHTTCIALSVTAKYTHKDTKTMLHNYTAVTAVDGFAYSLRNPNASTSGDLHDVTFMESANPDMVWVSFRQCDYDNLREITVDEARDSYSKCRKMGYLECSPVYRRVLRDQYSRIRARH